MSAHPTNVVLAGDYEVGKEIGKGSFAHVYKGRHAPSRSTVAIKGVQYAKLNKNLLANLEAEVTILKSIHHPHVVSLLDYQKTPAYIFLIMEYCSLGDLSYFLKKRHALSQSMPLVASMFQRYPSPPSGGCHEELARHFLTQLSSAIKFLRERNLVHRDIKPQNLLLSIPVSSPETALAAGTAGLWELPVLKLADFGFARFLSNTSLAETLCGSPLYMAPEILRHEKYSAKADLWSVGAVFYELLTGKPPYQARNHIELLAIYEKSNEPVKFPTSFNVSQECRSLVRDLLKKNPIERIGFSEFFDHPAVNKQIQTDNKTLDQSSLKDDLFISEYLQIQKPDSQLKKGLPIQDTAIQSRPHSIERTLDTSHQLSEAATKKEFMDSSYVIVEKRAVEINTIADKLTQKPHMPRSVSSLQPRRISVRHGYSPTNALTRAISMASDRLFGSEGGQAYSSESKDYRRIPTLSTSLTEASLLKRMEDIITMANVVANFAEVKFSQVAPSEENLLPEQFGEVAQEAIVLFVKCLSLLSEAMSQASTWLGSNGAVSPSVRLVKSVQWIREKFNDILECAERTQALKSENASKINEEKTKHIAYQKLLFDRATELARNAAESEARGHEGWQLSLENYDTSIWMLKAVLETHIEEEEPLTVEDKNIIKPFLSSLEHRLASVERKIESHQSSTLDQSICASWQKSIVL